MPKGIPKNAVECDGCGKRIASPKDRLCPICRNHPTRQKYSFTPERDALLREAYAQKTRQALSEKLAAFRKLTNIPTESVKWRCRILGLRFEAERKPWSSAELTLLLDMAGEHPVSAIAQRLGRTHNAVKLKLCKLGHSCRVSHDGFTVSELAVALGVHAATVNRWTMRGRMKPYGGIYSTATVRRFLREHLQDLNLARCDQEWLKGELTEMMRGSRIEYEQDREWAA
ncbi:MAG TPA: hypothetical protein VMD97_01895 [Candidatus Aquilonibacter sp.]|nr:hypothetical protein [Candidatus Aquilonibacter sp.]